MVKSRPRPLAKGLHEAFGLGTALLAGCSDGGLPTESDQAQLGTLVRPEDLPSQRRLY